MAEVFSQLGSGILAGPMFLLQLAVQLGFCVVSLEKSCVIVRTVILSKGMRVSSKDNSSVRGYALIIGPLYSGPQRAARWSISVGLVYITFVLVTLPFVSVVALKTLFFNFYIV